MRERGGNALPFVIEANAADTGTDQPGFGNPARAGVRARPTGPGKVSAYCLRVPCEGGELWYHNLTGELLALNDDELRAVEVGNGPAGELARRWFLVPERYDERKLANQFRTVGGLLKQRDAGINRYVIFTTTDCNARCYYCYELGRRRISMTDAVAHDVASYIERRCLGQPVKIQWFGGEPLLNSSVIDVIAGDLAAAGIEFSSIMVSNAYLFNEMLVERAVRQWHLRRIQVTLDGTEAVYNRSKAYLHHEGSPFQRVMTNIGLLLEAGVDVTIRLNMDSGNADDLDILAGELIEWFGNYENVSIYTVLLRDFGYTIREFESWEAALVRYRVLQRRLIDAGVGSVEYPQREVRVNQCMADNDAQVTVLPDGRLGKCEHESEENLVGSIYEESFDQDMIDSWKEVVRVPECDGCLQYPTCIRLKKCAWHADGCTERNRAEMRINLTQKVLNEYARYKESRAKEGLA